MGAETLCVPQPNSNIMRDLGVNINYNIDEAIDWADAVNVLQFKEKDGDWFSTLCQRIRNFLELLKINQKA